MSDNGPAKRGGNSLFLQVLPVMKLLSEKVYISGLASLWLEITCIPNIPPHPPHDPG
jgi:hypothetical protein